MIERVYVEIGNICNLKCSFCPSTKRAAKQMSVPEFREICEKLQGHTKYIYLHVMGEPLLHPNLEEFLEIASDHSLRVCITTNGTLLDKKGDILLAHPECVHKVCISLHSMEGNGCLAQDEYISKVCKFAKGASERKIYTVFRLWNIDSRQRSGANRQNSTIEDMLRREFSDEWTQRRSGYRIAAYTFLEYAGIFSWPIEELDRSEEVCDGRCHGLCDQIAILADGTVVPCCLDSEGVIDLGNIFESSLCEIVHSDRATAMADGIANGKFTEQLCRHCSYARRFSGGL